MGKKNISVHTLSNGYELIIDGAKFMAFNEKDLLHGVIYHLGFEELGEIQRERIPKLEEAAEAWVNHGKAIKEILRLTNENERLRAQVKFLQNGKGKQLESDTFEPVFEEVNKRKELKKTKSKS